MRVTSSSQVISYCSVAVYSTCLACNWRFEVQRLLFLQLSSFFIILCGDKSVSVHSIATWSKLDLTCTCVPPRLEKVHRPLLFLTSLLPFHASSVLSLHTNPPSFSLVIHHIVLLLLKVLYLVNVWNLAAGISLETPRPPLRVLDKPAECGPSLPLQRDQRGKKRAETEGEARKRERGGGSWMAGSGQLSSLIPHFMSSLSSLLCFARLSRCITVSPSVFACWLCSNSCGRKWRAKCHLIAPICSLTSAPVSWLTPAHSPYHSFSHISYLQIWCPQRLHALSL